MQIRNCRLLNGYILRCQSYGELYKIINDDLDQFNAVNCSTALYRSALLGATGDCSSILSSLIARTLAVITDSSEQLNSKTLSSIAWAVAKLSSSHSILLNRDSLSTLYGVCIQSIKCFDARGIAQLVWSMATTGFQDSKSIKSLLPSAMIFAQQRAYKSQEISMLAWGFCTLNADISRSFLTEIAKSCLASIDHFTGQGLAHVAWTLARYNLHHPKLMSAIAHRLHRIEFDLQALASIAWSFNRLELANDQILATLSDLVLKSSLSGISSKTAGQLLDAFSSWNVTSDVIKQILESLTSESIASMNSSEAVHMLGCISKLPAPFGCALDDVVMKVSDSLHELQAEELGIAAAALNRLFRQGRIKELKDCIRQPFVKASKKVINQLNWRSIGHIELLQRITCGEEFRWQRSETKLASKLTNRMQNLYEELESNAKNRNASPLVAFTGLNSPISKPASVLLMGNDPENILDAFCRDNDLQCIHWCRNISSTQRSIHCWDSIAEKSFDACIIRFAPSIVEFKMMIDLAASKLSSGDPLWVCGLPEEGISGMLADKAFIPMFTKPDSILQTSNAVILSAKRSQIPHTKSFGHWFQTRNVERHEINAPEWHTAPGLFAGGLVDVMTAELLRAIEHIKPKCRILDFGCGSGVISASLLRRFPSTRIVMTDCDSIALTVAKRNVPDADHVLADGWHNYPKLFHMIVSNPPYHSGQMDSFTVVQNLIDGAVSRLKPGGSLYIVSQEQVPIGRLFACSPAKYELISLCPTADPRFVVWKAVTYNKPTRIELPSSEKPVKRRRR